MRPVQTEPEGGHPVPSDQRGPGKKEVPKSDYRPLLGSIDTTEVNVRRTNFTYFPIQHSYLSNVVCCNVLYVFVCASLFLLPFALPVTLSGLPTLVVCKQINQYLSNTSKKLIFLKNIFKQCGPAVWYKIS